MSEEEEEDAEKKVNVLCLEVSVRLGWRGGWEAGGGGGAHSGLQRVDS